jgi:hypothetical protein
MKGKSNGWLQPCNVNPTTWSGNLDSIYWITEDQKKYLRKVYRILMSRTHNPYPKISDLLIIQYKVEMEFINRVLGDLYYTDEDKTRLNGLKVYLKG